MAGFASGEERWVERLGGLRNVIRQELVARQMAAHVGPGGTVLDVGCGQGTQGLRLARRGCTVTGVDQSPELLARFATSAAEQDTPVELLEGPADDLDAVVGDRTFDVVCAHGLLMYLPDRDAALRALAARVADGGLLSLTFRNAHSLAMRPGLRGEWDEAIALFDAVDYVNELGVTARSDRLEDIEAVLASAGLATEAWYGVRVLNDAIPVETRVPPTEELERLLHAEQLAGSRDPYRWMASQLHVLARRA